MGIGIAIKQLRLSKGLSQRQLARDSGVAQATISYLEREDPESSRYIPEFATALGLPAEDLAKLACQKFIEIRGDYTDWDIAKQEYRRDPPKGYEFKRFPRDNEIVFIPEYRVEFSAGDGTVFDYAEVEEGTPKAYSQNFFHSLRVNPNKCKRFKVSGNSMEPLLYDGDSILVVEESIGTPIRDGQVYIVRYDNELKVKRVSKNMDGSVTLRSVNSAQYADFTIPAEDVGTRFTILGKVIEKCGTGGLAG